MPIATDSVEDNIADVNDSVAPNMGNGLEKLPLPSIDQSINALLKAVQPLQSADDFQQTFKAWNGFKTNKLLNILQRHLEDYSSRHACYLDLFSNVRDHNATNIYSEYRGKTLPKNPYFILENDPNYWSLLPPGQSERAAMLIFSTLRFISTIKKGKLPNDVTPKSNLPLSMKSYNYLFGSTRYPSENGHGINIKHFADSKHLVILCDGNFHYLKVLNENNDILISQLDLRKIFDKVIDSATKDQDKFNISVGSITTESRQEWYYSRKQLSYNEVNNDNLKVIDSALLVVNLDLNNFIIDDANANYFNICHGTSNIDDYTGEQRGSCNSRWYDKLQLIVSKDSLASVVWEPTSNDATVVLRYVSDIYTDSILRLARNINNLKLFSLWPDANLEDAYDGNIEYNEKLFYPLEWDFNDNRLLHRLHLAETRLGDLLCLFSTQTQILYFGGNFAKKTGLNSDSLIQLAIQLTHYALYGKMVSSCESVSTRRFEHARSELAFIQSTEILKIGQTFISDCSDVKRWTFIKRGIDEINRLKKNAREGKGFEKHMKALRLAFLQKRYLNQIKSEGIPQIPDVESLESKLVPEFLTFDDGGAFNILFDPEILAINCGNPSLKAFGITPYKPNGFGIGYIIKDDYTVFTISSNFRQNDRFLDTLNWVFGKIKHLYSTCERRDSFSDSESENGAPYTTADMIRSVSMTLSESLKNGDADGKAGSALEDEGKQADAEEKSAKEAPQYNVLGGYGYFDVGELEFRSQSNSRQISRVQSFSNLISIKE